MKRSEVLEAFKNKVMEKAKKFEAHPSKVDSSLKRSIYRDWGDTLLVANGLLKDSTSPAEYEELLLKTLDDPHCTDPLLCEFEMLFLDLVLDAVEWEDE